MEVESANAAPMSGEGTDESDIERREVERDAEADGNMEAPEEDAFCGRIVDDVGTPIEGASVTAIEDAGFFSGRLGRVARKRTLGESRSDASGWFAIPASTSVRAQLRAVARDFVPSGTLAVRGTPVKVVLREGGRIQGRVRWRETGEPALGARVRAERVPGHLSLGPVTKEEAAEVRTGESGEYLLSRVPVGEIQLRVLQAGATVQGRKMNVSAGGLEVLDFELEKGGTVTGKIRDSVSGQGVEGAVVTWVGGVVYGLSAESGEGGAYSMSGIHVSQSGEVPMWVEAEGYGRTEAWIKGPLTSGVKS